MKTIEIIYNEIKNNEALQAKLVEAVKASKVAEFFKELDCEADMSEIIAYGKKLVNTEISDNELDAIAGGANKDEAILSAVTLGFGCAVAAIASACGSGVGDGPDGRLLCNDSTTEPPLVY